MGSLENTAPPTPSKMSSIHISNNNIWVAQIGLDFFLKNTKLAGMEVGMNLERTGGEK